MRKKISSILLALLFGVLVSTPTALSASGAYLVYFDCDSESSVVTRTVTSLNSSTFGAVVSQTVIGMCPAGESWQGGCITGDPNATSCTEQ